MQWSWVLVALLASAAAKGKKHHKPGRALLDRLSSTTVGEVAVMSGAGLEPLPPATAATAAPLDAAPYATVEASATCGQGGAEEYCRETPAKRVVCDMCEGASGSGSRQHPAAHALDGDPRTWWQSPSLAAGDYQRVDLVATLPHKMELLHVIIKSGPSSRPLAWSLDVSDSPDEDDWVMIKAFGDKEHCRKLWGLRPERRRRKARGIAHSKGMGRKKATGNRELRHDGARQARGMRANRAEKPTCSTQFASPRPLENGEMHVALGEGVMCRRVRISFRASHPAPDPRRYYTVRALTLAARCPSPSARGATDMGCACSLGNCSSACPKLAHNKLSPPCNSADSPQFVTTPEHEPEPKPTKPKHVTIEPKREVETTDCDCWRRGGSCFEEHSGVVICVNCTENRAGPLCDRCLDGYYSATADGPCEPCGCHPEGSDGSCTFDSKHHKVACTCRPEYTGARCDSCLDPDASLPGCQPLATTTARCRCDPRGIVDPEGICDEVCECKEHVVGERCSVCAPGYFGLAAALAGGCQRCYCSHVADHCVADTNDTRAGDLQRDTLLPLSGWLVASAAGNETLEPTMDDQGNLFLISYEVEGWESFYWVSWALGGEQLALYGQEVRARMAWAIVRGDTGGSPAPGADLRLTAKDGTKLSYKNRTHDTPGDLELVVPLVEGDWFRETDEGPVPASRGELMDVLRDLREIMIRAHFHGDQDEVRLESVWLRTSGLAAREQCSCPLGYSGAHCQACAWGHVQVPGQGCLPCPCNGHATCHDVSGPCGPCQHNTTGAHCERCLPGHYGNPVQGACVGCACPLADASNNFSPNCALAAADGDAFVCTQCPDGYAGDHCETCELGYWGSPTTPGGSCRPCACGGSGCARDSGRCLACPPHTEGATCDQCQEGYWFGPDAPDGDGGDGEVGCVPCACGLGALAAACDSRTGACACRDGWGGRGCDTCAPGHGDVSSGCPRCKCGVAALGIACDATTGACACAAGAAPPHCDACQPGHYGLHAGGCHGCNCSGVGAESNVCDIRSGQCRCRPHHTGRACDECEEGFWAAPGQPCRRCACGAGASACDPRTGACACARGVTGAHCDTCLHGYYGFGPQGCLQCPICPLGKVCSAESGRCVCPAHAHGPRCQHCAPGYWHRAAGCRRCQCGPGATTSTCDPLTGKCQCRVGWSGDECDLCAPGYFGPRCRPCHCHAPGTNDCANGTCVCDSLGQCPCKENVVGEKCDQCLEGTFGLSAENPSGCTACFCFGRSAHCTQAAVTRAALHAGSPTHLTLLMGDAVTEMDQESLLAIHTHSPDVTISLPWPPVPVYMELDKRFLGDRVTSYGGALRFRVEEEGGTELPAETIARFPLVRLYGRNIVLDYHERVPPVNGTHAVRLHESLWSVRTRSASGALASRGALMLALQQLDRVLLRVTTRAPTRDEHVHALLLNVSLDTAIPGLSRSAPALGVELCDCPRGYAAASCHQPALGFWIPAQKVHLKNVAGTIVINVEGGAMECQCNGRASACDPVTGDCLNCTHGTGGPRCSECAPGFHGAAGGPRGCQPCPCPDRARNFANACATHHGKVHCLCKPGYTGSECESCAADHYRLREACAPCACDARGARGAACDARGRCRCRPHATGDKCDQCVAPRTFLDGDTCTACDNCTQTLLDSMEAVTSDLRSRSDLTELSRIPKPFPALLEFAHNTTFTRQSFDQLKKELEHSRNADKLVSLRELNATGHRLLGAANTFKTEAHKREKEALSLNLESMSGLEEAVKQKRLIADLVVVLSDFAKGEKHLSAHKAIKEAKHLLRKIKEIKLIDYIAGAEDVADTANVQSTSVQEYAYRVEALQQRVRRMQAALEQWEARAADLPRLADHVWTAGDRVAALAAHAQPRLAALRDVALRCRLLEEDIIKLSPSNVTEEARSLVGVARALMLPLPATAAELGALVLAAEEKEGILYSLTPQYRDKYLAAVERHVGQLGDKARQYKSLFAGTRARASPGVAAARAWADVAGTVRSAALAADAAAAAAAAASQLAGSGGHQPMTHTANLTKALSEDLKAKAADVLARAEELRAQLDQVRRGADLVSVSLRGLGWRERELGLRPSADVAATLAAAGDQADRVFATTRVLYDEASEVRRRVRYNLRRQLAELQRHGDTALGAAQEHLSQIRGNSVRGAEVSSALAHAAAARAGERAEAQARARPALATLRDNIARARHAAGSISVSLTSVPGGVGCARAYSVAGMGVGQGGAVTRVALAVSFDGHVRDGPLLYLEGDDMDQEPAPYMKLWVEGGIVRLRWQLGGGGAGHGALDHPHQLSAAHDDGDHTSYRIDIERIWGKVRLRVERAGGTASTVSNSNSSAHGSGSANAALRVRTLWLGWPGDAGRADPAIGPEYGLASGSEYDPPPPEYVVSPPAAPALGLPGCVHALYWDDSAVGLWNFQRQPKDAKCTGCTQRWYKWARSSDPLAWFGGAGYAELRRSALRPPDRRQFSVALTVRTTDEDALLFMANDAANNRSVQVLMRSCRIVFAVVYGGGARLEIAARGRHCLGRPAHVQAIRVFAGNKLERGSLRVNGEETLGSPSPPVQSLSALPELAAASYWVGGAPPGAQAPAPPLLGCLGALAVDRQGYDLQDTPARHGVEPVCGDRTLRSATFEGSGHIELPSPLLRRRAAIGLSFRARAPGLLLLRAPSAPTAPADPTAPTAPARSNDIDDEHDGDDAHYLALALDKGELVLAAAAGKEELRLRTNGTQYTDGALHTVRIVRAHKQLELWVDGARRASGALAGDAWGARAGGLFVGGAQEGWQAAPGRLVDIPATGFAGTIADLIVDATLIGLETAVHWRGVRLGRADGEPLDAQRAEPRALQAPPQNDVGCTKTASYTVEAGAVKFGDAVGSYATLRLAARASRARELAVALHFRTYAPDGLLLLVPGSKAKPKHYVALMVREGRLRLVVRGRRRKELTLPARVADGTWHEVSIVVSRSRVVVSSGGAASAAHAPAAARAPTLYVGGIPPPPALPHLPRAIVRVGGFVGCVRRVAVDARAQDLVRDARAHHRVSQCFPNIEQGAYFPGDAHAVVSRRFAAAEGWEARLAFRSAAPHGLLLATGGVALELATGAVVLKRVSPSGAELSRAESLGVGGRALCDNAWHVVALRVSRGALALALDGGPELRGDAGPMPGLRDDQGGDDAAQHTPLYIGGVPEGASEMGEGREGFKGCIKDVSVGGHQRPFPAMEALHNVLLDSCPVAA